MAWTSPATYSTGYLLTASDWNTQVTANLEFLKTPTQDRLANQSGTNTGSATFVDITGATFTKTTNAAAVEFGFIGSFSTSAALTADITILVDGANQGDTSRGLQTIVATGIQSFPTSFGFRTAVLSAGSHTIKMQWKTSTGTLSVQNGWSIWIVER